MKILIIEEDFLLADSLRSVLEGKGFDADIQSAARIQASNALPGPYDLLILDIAPNRNCCMYIRHIRDLGFSAPILVLAEDLDSRDRSNLLNAGADLYLPKPADKAELMACVNALMRRHRPRTEVLTYGNTTLDLGTCCLICGDQRVRLSGKEFDVMRILLQSTDRVIPKEMILAQVWGLNTPAGENHVEVYVGFLRKKLTTINSDVRIMTLRRLGYHLDTAKR